jgi:hypothetical protein
MARWFLGKVGWAPSHRLPLASNWFADTDANSMSAFYGDLDYQTGDFVFTMLFVHGTAGASTSFTQDGGITEELVTLAPAAPRRAFAYKSIAPDPLTTYGLTWEWDSEVAAANINVAIHRSGLDYWTIDYWDDGPAGSALVPGYEIHLGMIVFVWSDAGSTVAGATLIERSDVLDTIGVVEAWLLNGVPSGTSTVDIDVTALSGDLQWVAWVDVFEL